MNIHKIRLIGLLIALSLQCACGGGSSDTQNISPSSNLSVSSSTPASVSSIASSTTSNVSSSAADFAQKIDAYLVANQSASQPGIGVLIVKDGKIVYSVTKGMADIPAGVAISTQTGFRLASVSKPFTAIAILQLVEKGQLNLSDSVLDHIPELPSSWRKITIDHLLSHRSGIYDIINDGWRPSLLNGMTNSTLLNYLNQNPQLEFEPGTAGDYSNTGFMLLATVVERVSGLRFGDYMAAHFFGPAAMNGSYINDEHQSLKNGDALNYARLRTYYGITTYFKGSMAQVSSINDFANFFAALRNEKLISAKTFAIMATSHGTLRGGTSTSGYGIFISGDYLLHDGEWDGVQTAMGINARKGLEWVILTNSGSSGRANINAIRSIIFATDF